MRSTLEQFCGRIDELRSLMAASSNVEAHLRRQSDPMFEKYLRVRRSFDYAGLVVVLYAAFEQFVEDLVWSYAQVIAKDRSYGYLPKGLIKKHLAQSADLLTRRLGEGRYAQLSERMVVTNLFQCVTGAEPYTLTREAIIQHEQNLRAEEVATLFRAVGIEDVNARARATDALIQWSAARGDGTDVLPGVIEAQLNALVERRNEIAHRGGKVDEVAAPGVMIAVLDFLAAYGLALFEVAADAHLRIWLEKSEQSPRKVVMVDGDGPYKKGTAIVVRPPPFPLRVGQAVCAFTTDELAQWGYVTGLQLNSVPVNEVPIGDQVVGVGLPFRCSRHAQVFLPESPDPLIWQPIQAGSVEEEARESRDS